MSFAARRLVASLPCLAVALLGAVALPVVAAGAHAGSSAPPSPPPPPAAANLVKPVIPLGELRQRLEERIAAMKQPGKAGTGVLRVEGPPAAAPSTAVAMAAPSGNAPRAPAALRKPAASRAPAAGAAVATDPLGRPFHADAGHGPTEHWAYEGGGGPERWGAMRPDFTTCSQGKRQSPIDIRDGIAVDLEALTFDYRPSGFSVIDNGHTVQVDVAPGNHLTVGGRRYELLQFHFHRPSEERISGRQFEMVAHLVHKDPEGRLAVVAVLMDQGKAHPLVQLVWNNLPLEKLEAQPAPVDMDLDALLPDDRRYYTYMGSLTTPPCSEGVLWIVLKQPATMSPEQIGIFARLYPMNARPIQSASGRLIKESN
jgi:carbonic anhydrase